MGAILRVLAVTGKAHEGVVEMDNIDTVTCEFNDSKPGDVGRGDRKGRITINTKYGNDFSFNTGVDGIVKAFIVDQSNSIMFGIDGIDGALIIHTAYCVHREDEKKFSQYLLGKGGYVPSEHDDTDRKSDKS